MAFLSFFLYWVQSFDWAIFLIFFALSLFGPVEPFSKIWPLKFLDREVRSLLQVLFSRIETEGPLLVFGSGCMMCLSYIIYKGIIKMNTCFICVLEYMFYYESLMIGCILYCEYVIFTYLAREITLLFDIFI